MPDPEHRPLVSERRRECSDLELTSALVALDETPDRLYAAAWPPGIGSLDQAGLYAWWTDAAGAADLTAGLAIELKAGRIYAGQTGATKWPSGKVGTMSLGERIARNHLGGTIRGSTFRLSLASILREHVGLRLGAPRKLDRESEARVTQWMRQHLEIAVHVFPNRDGLGNLERRVLEQLDPPLNLNGMQPTPIRLRLTQLRRELLAAGSKGFGR